MRRWHTETVEEPRAFFTDTAIGTLKAHLLRVSVTRARSYMTLIDLLHNLTYIKNYKNSVI